MDMTEARKLSNQALTYLRENDPKNYKWAEEMGPHVFKGLRERRFFEQYCYVIYASGFNVEILQNIWPRLSSEWCDFEPHELKRMRSIERVLKVFNNRRKAECFLAGVKEISKEGFSAFKKRVATEMYDEIATRRKSSAKTRSRGLSIKAIENLPGLGPITKYHLAKNIGLLDAIKPDIWVVRAAAAVNASPEQFGNTMAEKLSVSKHLLDVAIWEYGRKTNLGGRWKRGRSTKRVKRSS